MRFIIFWCFLFYPVLAFVPVSLPVNYIDYDILNEEQESSEDNSDENYNLYFNTGIELKDHDKRGTTISDTIGNLDSVGMTRGLKYVNPGTVDIIKFTSCPIILLDDDKTKELNTLSRLLLQNYLQQVSCNIFKAHNLMLLNKDILQILQMLYPRSKSNVYIQDRIRNSMQETCDIYLLTHTLCHSVLDYNAS